LGGWHAGEPRRGAGPPRGRARGQADAVEGGATAIATQLLSGAWGAGGGSTPRPVVAKLSHETAAEGQARPPLSPPPNPGGEARTRTGPEHERGAPAPILAQARTRTGGGAAPGPGHPPNAGGAAGAID